MNDANRNQGDAPQMSTAVLAALHQGNKIEAIKIIRQERNIGLKEAKDAIEDYMRSQPALQLTYSATQAEHKRSLARWLIVVVVLVVVGYYFLTKH